MWQVHKSFQSRLFMKVCFYAIISILAGSQFEWELCAILLNNLNYNPKKYLSNVVSFIKPQMLMEKDSASGFCHQTWEEKCKQILNPLINSYVIHFAFQIFHCANTQYKTR